MPRWLVYTLIATAIWGVWGIVSALVSREVSPLATQVICTFGMLPPALLLFFSPNWKQGTNLKRGIIFAALTGLSAGLGNLCLLRALSLQGPIAVVLPVSGMFPLVTALLAIPVLGERLNRIQGAGFVAALAALYIVGLAMSGAPASERVNEFPIEALTSQWMLWTFAALAVYGGSAFLQKVSTFHCSNELCTIVFSFASILLAAILFVIEPSVSFKASEKGWLLSLFFGALIGVGSLLTFAGYREGKASVVTPIIGLYPALTVLLAAPLMHERLDTLRVSAVVLAVTATVALGCESKPQQQAEVI